MPAGMPDTEFLRSDELPGPHRDSATCDRRRSRTNVFHLPVRGSGDGGIYSTAADFSAFWPASSAGGSCSPDGSPRWSGRAATCRTESMRYGLGFWLHQSSAAVMLEGYDAGVSFRSVHDPETSTHAHRDLQQLRRDLAGHRPPRRPAGDLADAAVAVAMTRRYRLKVSQAAHALVVERAQGGSSPGFSATASSHMAALQGPPGGALGDLDVAKPGRGQPGTKVDGAQPAENLSVIGVQGLPAGQHDRPPGVRTRRSSR